VNQPDTIYDDDIFPSFTGRRKGPTSGCLKSTLHDLNAQFFAGLDDQLIFCAIIKMIAVSGYLDVEGKKDLFWLRRVKSWKSGNPVWKSTMQTETKGVLWIEKNEIRDTGTNI
jgi:hypothetical protein